MSADRVGKLTSIGKYRIIRELGRGGMGVVYLAEDTRLQRQVALKILHPFLSMDEEFVRRFTSEAQAIAALSHRGIVRVHAFEEVDGSHLIDMEYIEGGSLDKVIAAGACSPGQALAIALRVFEALAACHAQGIVHRDIKPSNILMASDGRVLLTDFGLARSCAMASASTATSSSFIGTPKYAAPESWGRATPTPAGDVYSAGLVLLELLAGKTPFDGDSPLEIMRKTLLAAPIAVRALLPDGSNELITLLEELLVADPARRPANAGQALQCLQAIPEYAELPDDSSETIRVTPTLLRGKAMPRSGRRTARVAVATLLVALFIGLAWIFRPVPSPEVKRAAHNPTPVAEPKTPVPSEAASPEVNNVFAVGEQVAFTATVGDWRTLWVHDRATDATKPLWPELALEPEDDIHGVYPIDGGVIAVIRSDVNGFTLFRTDGTPEGTFTLAHAASRFANRILSLGSFAGKAYFNRIGGDGTYGLWETDGSLAGTRHVWGGQAEQHVTDLGITSSGGIFFTNHNNRTVHYLAPEATVPTFLGARPNSAGYADRMIVLGDQVLVEANDGEINSTGRELWIADREAGSLRQIRDFLPGAESGLFEVEFGRFREEVVFSAATPEHGREPWLTNGTPEGTRLLCDVNPGSEGSAPLRFVESGGRLYFSARDAIHGQELWVSDGTGADTRLVADINPGKRDGAPHSLRPFRDGVLFTSQHPDYGEEVWFSDGTKEGTRIVLDCMPGPEGRGDFGTLIMGDRAIFSATHPKFGRVLWESDGSTAGTRPLFERLDGKRAVVAEPAGWKVVGDTTFLTMTTPEHGAELWATDLNSGESKIVCDIHRGPEGSNPHNFFELDSTLYFTADDGVHGVELWSSNGSAENTKMVHDAWNGKGSGNPRYIVQWDEKRFAFVAFNGVENGIYSFHVPPGIPTYSGKPSNLRSAWDPSNLSPNIDGWLYFSNQTNSGETTVWRTDGTHVERVPGLGRDSVSN